MKEISPCVMLICAIVSSTSAANILVLSPNGPRSHMYSFMPLVEELAERGHQVAVVTAHEPKTDSANIRKIVLSELVDIVEAQWYDFKQHSLFFNNIMGSYEVLGLLTKAYDIFMANKEIQEIKRNKNFDLVILDGIVNEFAYPLVGHIGAPFVIFDPGFGAPWNLANKGASPEYAYIPPFLGNYGSQMTFFQRVNNMVMGELLLWLRRYYVQPTLDELAKNEFPNSRPIVEIERDAQLCLVNNHPTTSWIRPLPPTVISIGSSHVRPAKPLPENLKLFADGANDGLIVFTLGSNTIVSSMPRHIVQTFFRVFARLPQRIVWKWEKESEFQVPSNVKLVDWLPQQDLLGHKNTRLFIAHGGLMGIQEAVYHSVPVLGLPLGRDQGLLLTKAFEEGYALKINWEDLTEELLYESIQKILNQPSFKENVTRLSQIIRDELMPARKVAAYWIEHVLRHGGAQHLQSQSGKMPYYQLYLLDVWLFFIALISLLAFVLCKLKVLILQRSKAKKVKAQ